MVTRHLTDEEIQLFVLDETASETSIAQHIQICHACKTKAETYQLLLKGISQQPAPVFDFDLAATVLDQLPAPATRTAGDRLLTWIFIVTCSALIGAALYFFRGYLNSIFKGIAGISIYLMTISAITVIAILFVEMYRKSQKEMKLLDLY